MKKEVFVGEDRDRLEPGCVVHKLYGRGASLHEASRPSLCVGSWHEGESAMVVSVILYEECPLNAYMFVVTASGATGWTKIQPHTLQVIR